ncbi:MAG: M81 family metallopeptidase [Deltaproteobacteria bacterium]|nr:M81 family metallopeptidase [Deltaproteobacteria bacterium]MBW2413294.1 M81 family metallopeptidase [Deltaproteobacteria bacterium]
MALRVAIAGVSHETNSYCKGQTQSEEFWTLRGDRVLRLAPTATDVGGMLAACEEIGATPVPTLVAGASPSGVIAAEVYAGFKREILERLRDAGELDAVALSLHGAGVVDGIDDLEGDLAEAVRDLVGPGVPVVATFDLHGNVTQRMADALSLMFGCHDYPHTDLYDRGVEAVRNVPALVRGDLQPVTWVESVPALLPTNTTLFGPARDVKDRCLELEKRPGVVDCTFFHGFPYTDTPLVGAHFTVTTHGDRELARKTAQEAARYLWSRREDFRPESLSCEQAIERARAVQGRPAVINETSDNPGGGTPGDGTHLLRAMVGAGLENACFGFIVDPVTAQAAHAAGVGATIDVEIGGRYDDLHGAPLAVSAYVKTLGDGYFRWQKMLRGVQAGLGRMARLVVGGIDVIVSSNRAQTFDAEVFAHLGIDVLRYDIVALKSSHHFRAGFQELAAGIITADPPGLTTHQIQVFPRERAAGPLWPLDPDATYDASA